MDVYIYVHTYIYIHTSVGPRRRKEPRVAVGEIYPWYIYQDISMFLFVHTHIYLYLYVYLSIVIYIYTNIYVISLVNLC